MTSSSKPKHDVQSMQGTVLDADKIFRDIFLLNYAIQRGLNIWKNILVF